MKSHDPNFFSNIISKYEKNGEKLSLLLGENGDPYFLIKFKKYLKENGNFDFIKNELILEYYTSAFIGAINYWYKNKNKITIEEFVNTIYTLFLNDIQNKDEN